MRAQKAMKLELADHMPITQEVQAVLAWWPFNGANPMPLDVCIFHGNGAGFVIND